jgi:hypothetical protein
VIGATKDSALLESKRSKGLLYRSRCVCAMRQQIALCARRNVLGERYMGKGVAKDGWTLNYKLSNLLRLKATQS